MNKGDTQATSTERDQTYVLDVDYPSQFIQQQMPIMLSYVAALNGFRPPDPNQPYQYCELGCGTGETLNVLAAANPGAKFVGIDLNESHIQQCTQVANDACLENVQYINASFDALDKHDLPEFDFITTHGTYSWLPPSAVSSITQFLTTHLKSNGLFYVEFLTLPGKAAIQPVWHLMRALTGGQGLNAPTRAALGLDTLLRISAKGAQFFKKNEPAANVLQYWDKNRKENPLRIVQLAHQALAEHWTPRYITEVAGELDRAGLRYAGTTQLPYNDFELSVNEDQRPLFDDIRDPILAELLKDFVHNRHGRADIFIKSHAPDPNGAANFLKEKVCFLPKTVAAPQNMRIQRPDGSHVKLEGPAYMPLIQTICGGMHRLSGIRQQAELKNLDYGEILQAVHRLVAAGLCTVSCKEPLYSLAGAQNASMLKIATPFNRNQSARARTTSLNVVFASPILGGGSQLINPLSAALLEYALEQDTVQAAKRAWQSLRQNSTLIGTGHTPLPAHELSETQILNLILEIRQNLLPSLLLQGVLEPDTNI